jgi:hypothetical protein
MQVPPSEGARLRIRNTLRLIGAACGTVLTISYLWVLEQNELPQSERRSAGFAEVASPPTHYATKARVTRTFRFCYQELRVGAMLPAPAWLSRH